MTLERFEIVLQQGSIQFDGDVARGTDAAVVGQAEFLAQTDVQDKWHSENLPGLE